MAHGTLETSDIPQVWSEHVNRSFAFKEPHVVNPADGRVGVLLFEAFLCHTLLVDLLLITQVSALFLRGRNVIREKPRVEPGV
jgi:hypothetical protein